MTQHKFKAIALHATLALILTSLLGAAAAQAAPPPGHGDSKASVQATAPPSHGDFKTSVPAAAAQEGFADRVSLWAEKDGVLQVGLTSVHGNELAALKKHLGPDVNVFQQDVIESAVKKTRLAAKAPVKVISATPKKAGGSATALLAAASLIPGNYPPFIDSQPYYGGDRIVRQELINGEWWVFSCTVSSPYLKGTTTYMMTAGHCGKVGAVWTQGYYDGISITASGTMGTASSVQWGDNRTDGALLQGSSYSPYIWTNGSSYTAAHVTGAATVKPKSSTYAGTPVCTGGSFTGYACGGKVSLINACVNISEGSGVIKVCGLNVADSATPIVQHGDSGGPVVVPVSGGVQMAGTISAESNGGKTVIFSDVNYLQQIFAATVVH